VKLAEYFVFLFSLRFPSKLYIGLPVLASKGSNHSSNYPVLCLLFQRCFDTVYTKFVLIINCFFSIYLEWAIISLINLIIVTIIIYIEIIFWRMPSSNPVHVHSATCWLWPVPSPRWSRSSWSLSWSSPTRFSPDSCAIVATGRRVRSRSLESIMTSRLKFALIRWYAARSLKAVPTVCVQLTTLTHYIIALYRRV